jgi:hypothetical protein
VVSVVSLLKSSTHSPASFTYMPSASSSAQKLSVVSVVRPYTASASTALSAQLDGSVRLRSDGMLRSSTSKAAH